MDKRTIYSKTGKGSLEISKKSIKLASDERQTLILVDGKSSLGDIEEKLSRVSPVRLRAILDRLVELDLIREFVTKQGPDSIMPSLGGPTAMKVEELDELDFTALMPAASSNTAKEVEERRIAAMQAEEEAAAARVAERQAQQQRDAEEAARRQQQEAEQAAIRARADAEARARADAEAKARADAEAKARAEEDARRHAEEEARRRADEEARRKADEEARRRAEEEARRKAAEEAERRQREEAERRQREEAERREREEAERRERARREEEAKRAAAAEEKRRREAEEAAQREREREEALRREREEQEQRARAEAQRREREEAERREREDAERRAADEARERAERAEREEAERKEADRRERRRREEEAKRAAIAEEKRQREEAERRQQEQAQAAQREAEEAERRAADEAARYTAALSSQIDEVTSLPQSNDLDFNSKGAPATGGIESLDLKPLAGGGPDTFADTGMTANSIFEADASDEEKGKKSVEKEARRELEREAKESAKAQAKAKKEAEREAKRLAKESKVKIRRGGGSGFSLGKFIFIFILLLIGGGIGYLYFMPVDKQLVESQAGARLGIPVKVGTAKFEPFPPQLKLTDVRLDDIVLPRVTAVPDPGSLAADRKIWNSIDVAGATLTAQQVHKLIGIFTREAPAGVSATVQRVRITGLTVTGLPVALPPFDLNVLLAADGSARQATASLPDGKAQLQMASDEKGWTVDFESRGVTWGIGPKTAWESVRAKGIAKEDGVRFESIAFTHFGGTANGAGDLFWVNGWKFNGNLEVGGMETASISQAYYGAQPVSGSIDGKFKLAMSAPALPQLLDAAQIEGAVVVNKPAVNNIDLARSGQAGALTPGSTRFSDFAADLALTGPKVQIKNIRATSGLLTVSGDVAIAGDKSLSGTLNIELGIASNRSKSALRVSGTPADPKLSK
jgi:hypothetical protein